MVYRRPQKKTTAEIIVAKDDMDTGEKQDINLNESERLRQEWASKDKAAIVVGELSLVIATVCYVGRLPSGWLPIAASIVNAYLCIRAVQRKKAEGDNTSLNTWARILTLLSVLAMMGLILRGI